MLALTSGATAWATALLLHSTLLLVNGAWTGTLPPPYSCCLPYKLALPPAHSCCLPYELVPPPPAPAACPMSWCSPPPAPAACPALGGP